MKRLRALAFNFIAYNVDGISSICFTKLKLKNK